MANTKKCDRCGTFYEPRKKNSETLSVSKHKMTWGVIEEVKHSDLCFTCQLSLLEWFKVGSENLEEETPVVDAQSHKFLGWNIRYLREEKGMSQKQLGVPIGISASSISKWENHKLVPSDIMIERMAYIFDVTAHELRHKDMMLSRLEVSNNNLIQDED